MTMRFVLATAVALTMSVAAEAQTYPDRTIRIITAGEVTYSTWRAGCTA